MLSKNPLDPFVKVEGDRVAEIVRLGAIAELDAINLYMQLASYTNDESVKKVLVDIANEEKTHLGEFLELLKRLDPKQAIELEKGGKEVSSLLENSEQKNSKDNKALDPLGPLNDTEVNEIKSAINETLLKNAKLRSFINSLTLGDGTLAVPSEKLLEGEIIKSSSDIIPLQKLSTYFSIEQEILDYYRRMLSKPPISSVIWASTLLAKQEDTLIFNTLSSQAKVKIQGNWSSPGSFTALISKAINNIASKSQLSLVISPSDKAYLSSVVDPSGIDELTRVSKVVDKIVVSEGVKYGEALLIPSNPGIADIVFGASNKLDYIGLQGSSHIFEIWETLSIRVKMSESIALISKQD
ncbi:MAG: encapsulin [Caldisphaera sp.]|uniref:encapsulin n=1 Tax=Caldisphaera sp. TaxID=2060322 RepID=UPI0026D676F2